MLPARAISEMNDELGGIMHIASNHDSHSHMWTAETMSHFLEFLKKEIRRKRQSLGLDATHKALVLCDAASVHSTARFTKIRKTFEKEADVAAQYSAVLYSSVLPVQYSTVV